jgi:hypothetical protein
LPPQERLHEGALAAADLTEDDHVRIGDDARRVELERVEDERTAQEVVAYHHAPLAEARLRDERVGGAEVAGRDLMHGDARRSFPHARERSA